MSELAFLSSMSFRDFEIRLAFMLDEFFLFKTARTFLAPSVFFAPVSVCASAHGLPARRSTAASAVDGAGDCELL